MKKLLLPLFFVPTLALGFDNPDTAPAFSVYFDTDNAEVDPIYVQAITSGDTVTIVGHADVRHTSEYNLDLAMRRAQAVAEAMARSDATVETRGEGEPRVVCEHATDVCLQPNRRVDVFVACGITLFACTSEYEQTWMGDVQPEQQPAQVVSDRSRF